MAGKIIILSFEMSTLDENHDCKLFFSVKLDVLHGKKEFAGIIFSQS